MKTWKKLVAVENDVEFEYSDRLERPVLLVKAYFYYFQPFFVRTGCVQKERLPKIWRNRTSHDSVPFHVCLQFLINLFYQGTCLDTSWRTVFTQELVAPSTLMATTSSQSIGA